MSLSTDSRMRNLILTATMLLSSAAGAAKLEVYPYDGAKLLAGQKFDLRVEVEGIKDMKNVQITLDGKEVKGKTVLKTQTKKDSMEWTVRGKSLNTGLHHLMVTFQDGNGTVTKTARWYAAPPVRGKAKNVILFVGDGLGWNAVNAAQLVAHPYNPKNGMSTGKLAMMKDFDSMATITTSSYDSVIPDSANTASSMASGQKILVNALNVYPDNTEDTLDNPRIEPITAMLKRSMGKSVGIVSNTYGADATPAAFAAHTRRRGDYSAIVDQYFTGVVQPDVMLFGGSRDFIPSTSPGSRRKDNVDWIEASKYLGYDFVSSRTELNKADSKKLLGLFNLKNIPSYLDRAQYKTKEMLGDFKDMPYIWETTQKAVETLEKNPNGFFLMVEAGMVDKYAHPLDWQRSVWDILELDKAVAWAKEYAKKNPDTLILVTADHAHSISVYGSYDAKKGPGKRDAVGVYANAGFPTYGDKKDANGFPVPETARTYAVGFAATPDHCETYLGRKIFLSPAMKGKDGYEPNPEICKEGAVKRVGNLPKGSSTGVHTADPLPLFAFGPGSENFTGLMDQTDIFFGMARAMGLDATKKMDKKK